MKIGVFLKSNWAYLLWFGVYFTISYFVVHLFVASTGTALFYTGLLYAVSIAFAFLPIGEKILRVIHGARHVKTARDKEQLMPMYQAVFDSSFQHDSGSVSPFVRLLIIDDFDINACAFGRKSICVTRGAVNALSEDELKGIIAHEFGHLAHGNTIATLLTSLGNGFFSVIVGILGIFIFGFRFALKKFQNIKIIQILFSGIVAVFNFIIWLFTGFGKIILSLNSRESEFSADTYARNIGYGENLIEVLYTLRQFEWSNKDDIKSRITASHPYTDDRIEWLEYLEQAK